MTFFANQIYRCPCGCSGPHQTSVSFESLELRLTTMKTQTVAEITCLDGQSLRSDLRNQSEQKGLWTDTRNEQPKPLDANRKVQLCTVSLTFMACLILN